MQTVVTYYKNLTRWDVKSFLLSINLGENYVRLGSFLKKKKNQWDGSDTAPMLSLHFGGRFSERASNQIKGQLFVADKGDLVYSKIDLRNGAIGIIPEPYPKALFTTEFSVYEIDTKIIYPTYLQLYLRSDVFKKLVNSIVSGASGRKRVKPSDFENLSIYIPRLDIQMKIVNQWYAAQKEAHKLKQVANQKENSIADYVLSELGMKKKEYKNAGGAFVVNFKNFERWGIGFNDYVRQGLLDLKSKYEIIPLRKIILKYQYGTSEKANGMKGIPILRMNNIVNGDLDITDLKYIELSKKEFESLKLVKNDLLFNRTNSKELVGKTAVFKLEGDFVFASYLIRIKIDEINAEPNYINILFNLPIIRNQIDAISRQIIGQANVNTEELSSLKIPLPPLKVQNQITDKVEKMRQEIARIRNQADELLETNKSEVVKMLKA